MALPVLPLFQSSRGNELTSNYHLNCCSILYQSELFIPVTHRPGVEATLNQGHSQCEWIRTAFYSVCVNDLG
jgi:hypothetical protein